MTGDGTDTLVLTGTVAEINAILADADGVTYLNDVGFAGATDTVSLARRRRRPGCSTPRHDHASSSTSRRSPPT